MNIIKSIYLFLTKTLLISIYLIEAMLVLILALFIVGDFIISLSTLIAPAIKWAQEYPVEFRTVMKDLDNIEKYAISFYIENARVPENTRDIEKKYNTSIGKDPRGNDYLIDTSAMEIYCSIDRNSYFRNFSKNAVSEDMLNLKYSILRHYIATGCVPSDLNLLRKIGLMKRYEGAYKIDADRYEVVCLKKPLNSAAVTANEKIGYMAESFEIEIGDINNFTDRSFNKVEIR